MLETSRQDVSTDELLKPVLCTFCVTYNNFPRADTQQDKLRK